MDSQTTNRSCEKKNFLSRTEFAAESGLSTATFDRYLRDGRIRKYQPGGAGCRVLIPRSEFEQIGQQGLALDAEVPMKAPVKVEKSPRNSGPLPRWKTSKSSLART